jgi:para-nitrobenzyl esterase
MSNAAIVQTDSGPVRGTVTGEYRLFQGIPYAASTAGAQRWRSPEPVHAWTEPRDATKPGNICAQQPSAYADVASLDEVCLFLNVTTPRWTGADRLRPVMVWIHGDGAIGAGSFFDARPLVITGDVIVVTINYRLGIFGTFGYPGLDGSGTFGMQDQRAALRWVQRNAASFGGDPDNVTLFGESYGGLATSAHLISPGSQGLFHRAIIQSGFALMDMPAGALYPGVPAVEWFGWQSSAEVESAGAAVAGQLGCTDSPTALECLRRVPAQALVALSRPVPFAYGNPVLPEVPAAFGGHASRVHAQYPESAFDSPSVAWASVLTDRMWARSTFEQHHLFAEHVPTYAYEFADRQSPMYLPFPEDFPPGAFHAAEVPYLFNDDKFEAAANHGQRTLSTHMMRYWANFAHTGDPNGNGLPRWSPFDQAEAVPYVQSLAPEGISGVDYASEHHLDFWSQLP